MPGCAGVSGKVFEVRTISVMSLSEPSARVGVGSPLPCNLIGWRVLQHQGPHDVAEGLFEDRLRAGEGEVELVQHLHAQQPVETHPPGQEHVRRLGRQAFPKFGAHTTWAMSVADREFELRAHLYEDDGIGLDRFRRVKAGDPLTYWGPQGDFSSREADFHFFVGEEPGACGFGP